MSNTTDPTSFAPQEDATTLFTEKGLLNGATMTGIAYGIHFTLFILCAQLLFGQRKKERGTWIFIGYIITMFILGTLFMASAARVAQLTFIDDRNFPGGPAAFAEQEFSIPANLLGNVTFCIANWLADGLIIWRCMILWSSSRFYWIMIVPCLTLLTSFVMGSLLLVQVSQPNLSLWTHTSVQFALSYFSLSLSLNIFVTLLILTRLLMHRQQVINSLGKVHARQYTSIAAMMVESAALYSTFSIMFLVPYVLNHPIQNIFLQVLGQMQIIAPLLIIFRVARGNAWSSTTYMTTRTGGTYSSSGGSTTRMSFAPAWRKNGIKSNETTTSATLHSMNSYPKPNASNDGIIVSFSQDRFEDKERQLRTSDSH